MAKRPTRGFPKIFAVIFGTMVLAGVALYPMLIYRWRENVRSETQYEIAPVCTRPEQSGCRREIDSVVTDTHYTYRGRSGTHYVSLSMPGSDLNSNIPIWWDREHSLYGLLKPGDRVTAEEWEGQIAAIRSGTSSTLRTEYDPTRRRRDSVISLIAIAIVVVPLMFIEYRLIHRIRHAPH